MSCGTSRLTMKMMNLANLIERLQGVAGGGGSWGARDPPSLSVLLKDILAAEQ